MLCSRAEPKAQKRMASYKHTVFRHRNYRELHYATMNNCAIDQLGMKRGSRTEDALASLLTAVPFHQNKRENLSSGHTPDAATPVDFSPAGAHEREASHRFAGPSGRSQVQAADDFHNLHAAKIDNY